jgi:hypothetical protein
VRRRARSRAGRGRARWAPLGLSQAHYRIDRRSAVTGVAEKSTRAPL